MFSTLKNAKPEDRALLHMNSIEESSGIENLQHLHLRHVMFILHSSFEFGQQFSL